MDNIQNKEVKEEGSHQSGGCHCALCSWKGGGWHGRHSILRIAVGVALILGAFCLGASVGGHDDRRGYDQGGYGHGKFERHMRATGGYEDVRYYGQPMMIDRQIILKTTEAPATGTQTIMGN